MRHIIAVVSLVFLHNLSVAQSSYSAQLVKVLPQSPNAATLLKFIDAPVGYYTGIPSISIPVFTATSGKLSVPISLSYHAGGVRVEDVASWVGLNWNLSAGGSIIRSKRGVIDENGYAAGAGLVSSFSSMTINQQYAYYQDVQQGLAESAPDMFSFSMPGESGKFFYDEQGHIVTKPRTRMQIAYGTYFSRTGWKIVNMEGQQFYFLETEESVSNSTSLPASPGSGTSEVGAWHLSKIVSPEGRDTISFEYEQEIHSFYTNLSATRYFPIPSTIKTKKDEMLQSWNAVTAKLLKKISCNNGTVTFYRNSSFRTDVTSAKALQYIQVENRAGQVIKTINFHTTTITSGAYVSADPGLNKRMYLDSVSVSGTGLSDVELYKFDYCYRELLPNRLSDNQDYWGYYNGADNSGKFLAPSCFLNMPGVGTFPVWGANRSPDSNATRYGTLNRVTYPTGGYADYEYEGNQAGNFPTVANVGFDIRDTVSRFQLFGDPNGITTIYSGSFTISNSFGVTNFCLGNITLGLPYATVTPPPPASIDDPVITLTMPDNTVVNLRYNRPIALPPGNYSVDVDFGSNPTPEMIGNFYLFIDYETGLRFNNAKKMRIPVGGLRVKKTRLTDPVGNNTIEKAYGYLLEDGSSSGVLGSFPVYTGQYGEAACGLDPATNYLSLSTISQSAAMMMQGAATGYSKVEEYFKTNGDGGKNSYYFSMLPDKGTGQPFPFPPANSMDEFRGILLKQETYKRENNQYVKISEKANNYNFFSQNGYLITDSLTVVARGLQFATKIFDPCPLPSSPLFYWSSAFYDTQTGWMKLLSDTARSFAPNAVTTEVVTAYQYSPNSLLQSKKTTRGSDGKYQSDVLKYPSDYTIPGGTTNSRAKGILALQQQHRLSQPVELIQLVSDDGIQEKATAGLFTAFDENTALPDTTFVLETTTPLTNFSHAAYAGGGITIDNRYAARALFNRYTQAGNIEEQQMTGDVPQSIIWDYSGQLPVAQATASTIDKMAYSSFESDNTGGWTIVPGATILNSGGITGNKSFSGTLQKQSLPAANYVVTLWSNTAGTVTVNGVGGTAVITKGTWRLYTWSLTNVTSVSIVASNMDEVRLYPAGAQMATYTYDPWIGITSQCDANNKIIYYEYDGMGRLKTVLDADKNILKAFDYKYRENNNQ